MIALLCVSSAAMGTVVTFDNSDSTFIWTGNGRRGIAGSLFDPTLAPSAQQSATFTARQLASVVQLGGGSTFVGGDGIGASSAIRLARNETPVIVSGPALGQQTEFRPATTFAPGQQVSQNANFESSIDTAYFNISLGRHNFLGDHAFIGFRVLLDDGLPHFGWIELEFRESPVAVGPPPLSTRFMYQPVRWAYESEPNTPITVVPGPGAAAFAIVGILAGRRRRHPN